LEGEINLQLLGKIQIEYDGISVNGFESQKAVALVCYLAYTGKAVSREKLATLFWENKPESRALSNLSRVLHNNNKLLPGCLQSGYKTIQIANPDQWVIDTHIINELESKGDIDSLIRAVELNLGDFLGEISLDECPEFDMWLIREQEVWRQKFADIYFHIINFFTQQGNYSEAMQYAYRLLEMDPWREEVHRRMMLLLAMNGQRLAAMQQYNVCCKILDDELGVEPSEETRKLYDRIRKGRSMDHSLAFPIPATGRGVPQSNLPSKLPPLEENEAELNFVLERIENPFCRLLTLVGDENDTRKEHMALHAAAKEISKFENGVFYYSLPKNKMIESLVDAVAESFQLFTLNGKNLLDQLFSFLRNMDVLLVITNILDATPVVEFLEGILKRAPNVKIIATAPTPLGLSAEWIYEVSANYRTDKGNLDL
jgi:DNA-binding SARP family transcriptional activator